MNFIDTAQFVPIPGEDSVEQLSPFVWRIPVRAEEANRFTNAYVVLDSSTKAIVVDPGWASAPGWQDLTAGLAQAGVGLGNVEGIILTHGHADHAGLAGRLASSSGSWIGAHPAEIRAMRVARQLPAVLKRENAWLKACGFPGSCAGSYRMRDSLRQVQAQLAIPSMPLGSGFRLPLDRREVRLLWTPGHSEGHLCLVDEDSELILTGDHILPTIAPSVGRFAPDGPDSILAYLSSLDRVNLWTGFEAAPAHEHRFTALSERVDELRDHIRDRWTQIIETLDQTRERTVFELAERLPWSSGWLELEDEHRRRNVGETLAHLNHLSLRGLIATRVADDGRIMSSTLAPKVIH